MASLYVDGYRPWPAWVVEANEEIANKFGAQIGTYPGHADRDPGHDMTGDLAADFFLYVNTADKHDAVLAWFKANAERIGATYIITRRRIWSVARASEGVRVYTGDDPHTGHIHISYGTNPPEDDMATPKELWTEYQLAAPEPFESTDHRWQPETYLRKIAEGETPEGRRIRAIEARVKAQDAKLDAILEGLIHLSRAPSVAVSPEPETPPA